MLELRTLGRMEFRDPAGRDLRGLFSASKLTALLSYLAIALPRGFHRRDTLVALLWPELDQEHARGALRQALYTIRSSITDSTLLRAGDAQIGLDTEGFWCDALAFEAFLDEGRFEEALALYHGDLLEGFHLTGCLEFERWLDGARRRLKQRAGDAAWYLAEHAEAEGASTEATRWGRRAAALSPDDEGVVQRLIALLDRVGDRAGAMLEYEAFADRLREDYKAAPAPETTALIESVRARERTNGAVLPNPSVTRRAKDTPGTSGMVEAGRSWRTRRLAGVLVALGTIVVVGATIIRNGGASVPTLDPTRVLVDIFQNETGDPSLDHLGRMATDRVTAGLTVTSFVDVVSLGARLLSREPVVPETGLLEPADLQALARSNGTGTVVSGSYYLEGDSVHFLAHVTDAGTGEALATLEPIVGAIDAPVAAIEQLRDRVMTTLATLTDPRLGKWMRHASQPPTFEAYTELVNGIGQHSNWRPREALSHFLAAATLDSNFTMALLWAGFAYQNSGRPALKDSIVQALDRRRHLAPLDRLLVDYELARRREDNHGALEVMRRLVEIAPGPEFLFRAGQAASEVGRPREAIAFLEQADPESWWWRGWWPYWDVLTTAHHMLGEHREELAAARRGRREFSHDLLLHELRALAALGRIDDVQAQLEEDQGMMMPWIAAGELLVHGHLDAASQVLDRGIAQGQAWLTTLPADSASRQIGNWISLLADMLLYHGRVNEARVMLEQAVEERAVDPYRRQVYIGTLGVIAGMQGDRQKALEIDQYLGAQQWNWEWIPAMWHARIAASLGEFDRATTFIRDGAVSWHIHFELPLLMRVLQDHPSFQEFMRPKG